MKPEKLFEIIGRVDDSFITEAAEYPQKTQGAGWFLRFAAAACLVLVIGASAWILRQMNYGDDANGYAVAGPGLNGDVRVIDFLAEFTSLFSFGTVAPHVIYADQYGNVPPTPLVRWDGADFINPDGEVIRDVPFILEGNRVARQFFLYDLGVGVPVVMILTYEYEYGSMIPARVSNERHWQMFQYADGAFVEIGFEADLPSGFWPYFVLDSENRLLMATLCDCDLQAYTHRGFVHVRLNDGIIEVIEELPHNFLAETISARLVELEQTITGIMRQRFGAETWYEPFRDPIPTLSYDFDAVYEIIPAFNEIMRIFSRGLELDGLVYGYEGRRYMAVSDPNYTSLQCIRDLIEPVFGTDPQHYINQRAFYSDTPFFREIDGTFVQHLGDTGIFAHDYYILFPQIATNRVEYMRTGPTGVFVSVNATVYYTARGAVRAFSEGSFFHNHTMALELLPVADGWRIANMEIVFPARTDFQAYHADALTGAIGIYNNTLFLDPVEIVWHNDFERMRELSLSPGSFTRDYHLVHDERPRTQQFTITPDTVFEFINTVIFGVGEESLGQWVVTTNPEYFRRQMTWGVRDVPIEFDPAYIGGNTSRRIVHFVYVNDAGEVTRVVQEFIFTQ